MKTFLYFIFIFLYLFSIFRIVKAEIYNPLKAENLAELLNAIIDDFLIPVSLALAPLMIVIGGYFLIASAGVEARIATGKKIILYTFIALLIILLAKVAVNTLFPS